MEEEIDTKLISWHRGYWKMIEPFTRGYYVNVRVENNRDKIRSNYGVNYARLVKIKSQKKLQNSKIKSTDREICENSGKFVTDSVRISKKLSRIFPIFHRLFWSAIKVGWNLLQKKCLILGFASLKEAFHAKHLLTSALSRVEKRPHMS